MDLVISEPPIPAAENSEVPQLVPFELPASLMAVDGGCGTPLSWRCCGIAAGLLEDHQACILVCT